MVRGVVRRGAAKAEYALMLMLVGMCCFLVVGTLGVRVSELFDTNGAATTNVPRGPDTTAENPADPTPGEDPTPGKTNKGKKGKPPRQGNPGNGNAGNDGSVGNAPDPAPVPAPR